MMLRSTRRVVVSPILVVLLLAGCATPDKAKSQYQRDGMQYGVTKGAFRGRWWNYYERGRSFQDGAFLDEAEKDLRTALQGRSRDQIWARSYGMHFIPEYFPHRELGVTFYYQKKYTEAVAELELSLEQQHSARAAYFLDLSRAALIQASGADKPAPTIVARVEDATDTTATRRVTVRVTATSDNYIAGITVGGERSLIPTSAVNVEVTQEIPLQAGQNRIDVEARDLLGKVSTASVEIFADTDGPVVSFDTEQKTGASVTGAVYDRSGVNSLRVGGHDITLVAQPAGVQTFAVPADVLAAGSDTRYECQDRYGNTTTGVIPPGILRVTSSRQRLEQGKVADANFASAHATRVILAESAVFGAADAPAAVTPVIAFANVRDGQEYLLNEIVVSVAVNADSPLVSADLNGQPIEVLPGRACQNLCRRVPLMVGSNELVATVHCASGAEEKTHIAVKRREDTLEQEQSRLSLAHVGFVTEGNGPKLQDEQDYVYAQLTQRLASARRFKLLDRTLLPEILQEQQLSDALSSDKGRLALNRIVPAETILLGRTHRDATSIEIVLEAFSTESSISLARADAAGRADTQEEIDELTSNLALQLIQQFPRVRGSVSQVRGKQIQEMAAQRKPVIAVSARMMGATTAFPDEKLQFVSAELERVLQASDRFSFVDRGVLDAIDIEKKIVESVGDTQKRLALGRLIPAQAYVVGSIRPEGNRLLLSLEMVSCESGKSITRASAALVDSSNDALVRGVRSAATPIIESAATLSKASGAGISAKQFLVTLGSKNLVKESTKYLVFRQGPEIVDPVSKEVLGRDTILLGEGLARTVNQSASLVDVLSQNGKSAQPIRVGDYVTTK